LSSGSKGSDRTRLAHPRIGDEGGREGRGRGQRDALAAALGRDGSGAACGPQREQEASEHDAGRGAGQRGHTKGSMAGAPWARRRGSWTMACRGSLNVTAVSRKRLVPPTALVGLVPPPLMSSVAPFAWTASSSTCPASCGVLKGLS